MGVWEGAFAPAHVKAAQADVEKALYFFTPNMDCVFALTLETARNIEEESDKAEAFASIAVALAARE